MGKMDLSEEEQLQLRNKAKSELDRLQGLLSDRMAMELVEQFKSKFSVCEIVYKIILEEHQFRKKGERPSRMIISMNQVPFALEFAGYNFDKNLLSKLFASKTRVGNRSAKDLRNSLTHSLKQSAVNELTERFAELNGYMDAFLEVIGNQDA